MGKIKAAWWRNACEYYLEQLRRWRPVEIREVRDGGASLDVKTRIIIEGRYLLAHMETAARTVALCEDGQSLTSMQFAKLISTADMRDSGRLIFVIGGPNGLADQVLQNCSLKLSLSAMTWTHEMARVLLLEQLFRAESILHNFPYHNE